MDDYWLNYNKKNRFEINQKSQFLSESRNSPIWQKNCDSKITNEQLFQAIVGLTLQSRIFILC